MLGNVRPSILLVVKPDAAIDNLPIDNCDQKGESDNGGIVERVQRL